MNRIAKTMPWRKWLIIFTLLVICVGMGTTQALAITSYNNDFTMMNKGGAAITGGMNDVIFVWDGTQRHSVAKENQVSNVQFFTQSRFFGFTWSTHDCILYGPGVYTVYTGCPAGAPGCGEVREGFPPLTFTVGPDELGVHYQFNWNVTTDIDMVTVFKRHAVFGPSAMCSNNPDVSNCSNQISCEPDRQPAGHPCLSPDVPRDKVWDLMSYDFEGDGTNGLPFVDGPFIGFSGNMNVMVPGGIPAHLLPDANPMIFGGYSSDKTLTITNNGDTDLVFPAAAVLQQPAGQFSITADNCSGKTLASYIDPVTSKAKPVADRPNCTITVHFESPGVRGDYAGSFILASNDLQVGGTRISLSAGNSPPDKAELVSPGNGLTGVGTEQEFRWKIAGDPEGDPVKYQVFVCTDPTFGGSDCSPAYIVSRNNKGVFYAGGAGLLIIGMTFIGGVTGRKKIVLLLIVVTLIAGGTFISCKSKDKSETAAPPAAGQMSYFKTGLTAGTTYYWKVVSDDGQPKNNTTSSDSWRFTTQ